MKCVFMYESKGWLFFLLLSFGISVGCITVRLPQGLFMFRALSQRRLIQSWCWQLLWKDGADIFYQTLPELLTRPSEMCCIDCRHRTLWSWNKTDGTLAEPGPGVNLNNVLCSCQRLSSPRTQTVKPGFSAVSPWGLKIGHTLCLNKIQEVCYGPGDDKLHVVLVCIYCFFHRCWCTSRGMHAENLQSQYCNEGD